MLNDLRFAFRRLIQSRVNTAAMVAMMTIGVSLSTVVFALADGVLFKPLPFHAPNQLFLVTPSGLPSAGSGTSEKALSWAEIKGLVEAVPEIRYTAVSNRFMSFHQQEGHEYLGAEVDEHFFDVLGPQPLLGGFSDDDFSPAWVGTGQGAAFQPVIISHRFWREVFAGDRAILNRTVALSEQFGKTFGIRVVGVLPRGFVFPWDGFSSQPDVLTPIMRARRTGNARRMQLVVRLGPNQQKPTVESLLSRRAQELAEAAGIAQRQKPRGVPVSPLGNVSLQPLSEQLARKERSALSHVSYAAGVLLLLACLNTAALAAHQSLDRWRDLAVRQALGAGLWACTRSAIVEAGVIVAFSATVSLPISSLALAATVAMLPNSVTLLKEPALDARVLVVVAVVTFVASWAVGLWPSWVAYRTTGRFVLCSRREYPRKSLASSIIVAIQAAGGYVLLLAGGLATEGFANAWSSDPGYQRDRMVFVQASVLRFQTNSDARRQLDGAHSAITELGGVAQVAVSTIQPMFGDGQPYTTVVPSGWRGGATAVSSRHVSANYFHTMGIALLEGRWPSEAEWNGAQPLAIVSAAAARAFWPNTSAIGMALVAERPDPKHQTPPAVVVAVVRDAYYVGLDTAPGSDIYLPGPISDQRTGVFFHVRSVGSAAALVPTLKRELASRGMRVDRALTHQDALFRSVSDRALVAWLFSWLGVSALCLLVTGVLALGGMMAVQRTKEVGIRRALGAGWLSIARDLAQRNILGVATGLSLGLLASILLSEYVSSQGFGVGSGRPAVWIVVAAVVAFAGSVGALLPCMRCLRMQVATVLRED